jgi:hypothetical protein
MAGRIAGSARRSIDHTYLSSKQSKLCCSPTQGHASLTLLKAAAVLVLSQLLNMTCCSSRSDNQSDTLRRATRSATQSKQSGRAHAPSAARRSDATLPETRPGSPGEANERRRRHIKRLGSIARLAIHSCNANHTPWI